jgi:formylglycine-generating enzyme required for sulfatase activity
MGPERVARKDVTPQQKWFEPEMVFVQGGTFTMGCLEGRDIGCDPTHSWYIPHSVTVSSFYIGKYEVTQAQWVAVMNANPSTFKTDDQNPVETVTFNDISTFINQLNVLTGKNYRLPTEAEWEYAARGGNKSQNYNFSGSTDANEVAWNGINSHVNGSVTTHPVGQKKPNELGIYDMSGNVWEFCSDWIGDFPSTPVTNPTGPNSSFARVLRGSDLISDAASCRIMYRHGTNETSSNRRYGFRLVLPAQ